MEELPRYDEWIQDILPPSWLQCNNCGTVIQIDDAHDYLPENMLVCQDCLVDLEIDDEEFEEA